MSVAPADFVPVDFDYLSIKFGSRLVNEALKYSFDDKDKDLFSEWLEGFGMDSLNRKPTGSLVLFHKEHFIASIYAVRIAMSLLRRRRRISHTDLGSENFKIPSDRDVCFLSMPKVWTAEVKMSTSASIHKNSLFSRFVMTTTDLSKTYGFLEDMDFYSCLRDDFILFDLMQRRRVRVSAQ